MKNLFKILTYACLCAGLAWVTWSCKEKCPESMPNSAQFRMYNTLINGQTAVEEVESDTFMVGAAVYFEATDPRAESYQWKIGRDDRIRTEKSFGLIFTEFDLQGDRTLEIELITTYKPDTECFPLATGTDTLRRTLTFLPFTEWPFYGKYLGSDDTAPNVQYVVEIFREEIPNQFHSVWLTGLLPECSNGNRIIFYSSINAFTVPLNQFRYLGQPSPFPSCSFDEASVHVAKLVGDRNTLVIDYSYRLSSEALSVVRKKRFTGVRIP